MRNMHDTWDAGKRTERIVRTRERASGDRLEERRACRCESEGWGRARGCEAGVMGARWVCGDGCGACRQRRGERIRCWVRNVGVVASTVDNDAQTKQMDR